MQEMGFSRIVLICFLWVEACGGGGGESSSPAVSKLVISSRPLAVQKGTSVQLTAIATDSSGNPVSQPGLTWSVDGGFGTITSGGLYSAPANIPAQNPVTVRATSVADSTKNDAVSFYILTGVPIAFPFQPTDTLFPQQGSPASFHIAVFNQNTYVVWAMTSGIYGTHLWYSKKGDLNGNFSTPHDILGDLLNYTITNYTVKNPVIALDNKVDASGIDPGVYIAWDDNSNGAYQVNLVKGPNSSSTGCTHPPTCFTPVALTGPGNAISLQVDPSPSDQENPSLAISPLGKLEFAWTQVYSSSSATSNLITYKELNGDGSVPKPPSQVSPSQTQTSQITPQIAVDHSGNVSVSWLDFNSGTSPPNILYSRMAVGQSFGSALPVETESLAPSDTFSMALDDKGQPHLAWSKTSSGTPTVVYYSTTSDFSKFTIPVNLTPGGYHPVVKVDLLNYLYFTWEDGISSLYFKKIAPLPNSGALTNSPLTKTGVNPAMNIDDEGRVYLLYSTTGSINLSTYFMRGD